MRVILQHCTLWLFLGKTRLLFLWCFNSRSRQERATTEPHAPPWFAVWFFDFPYFSSPVGGCRLLLSGDPHVSVSAAERWFHWSLVCWNQKLLCSGMHADGELWVEAWKLAALPPAPRQSRWISLVKTKKQKCCRLPGSCCTQTSSSLTPGFSESRVTGNRRLFFFFFQCQRLKHFFFGWTNENHNRLLFLNTPPNWFSSGYLKCRIGARGKGDVKLNIVAVLQLWFSLSGRQTPRGISLFRQKKLTDHNLSRWQCGQRPRCRQLWVLGMQNHLFQIMNKNSTEGFLKWEENKQKPKRETCAKKPKQNWNNVTDPGGADNWDETDKARKKKKPRWNISHCYVSAACAFTPS